MSHRSGLLWVNLSGNNSNIADGGGFFSSRPFYSKIGTLLRTDRLLALHEPKQVNREHLFVGEGRGGVVALALGSSPKATLPVVSADEQVNANKRILGVHVAKGSVCKRASSTFFKSPAATWFFQPLIGIKTDRSQTMFIGHLAVALGAKSIDRRAPLSLLIGASFGIDLLWPVFLLIGIETVEIDPGNTAFTPLNFVSYPWSHSLLTVLGWSLLLGLIARRMGLPPRGAILVGGLVTSHWILDWFTHRPDLPLWPGGKMTGLGLWNSIPATMVVEGSMLVIGTILFFRTAKPKGWKGWLAISSLLLLVVAIWGSQPFSPPPPSSEAIAIVGLSTFLLPLWGMWIEKQSTQRSHAA